MNVLVTGGTGFVGRHLLEALHREHQIYALARQPAKLDVLPFRDRLRVIRGDLFASEPFPDDIELVFHLAAVTKVVSSAEFLHINRDGTLALLKRLVALPRLKKVLTISSIAAAGPSSAGQPLREEMPARPVSLYGKSKLLQEEAVRSCSPAPFLIVRAPIVFGPGDLDMLGLLRPINRGFLPIPSGQVRRYSLIYVKDLVQGLLTLAFSPITNDLFYMANPEPLDLESFGRLVGPLLGRPKLRRVRVPVGLGPLLGWLVETGSRAIGRRAIFNRDKVREFKQPDWVCSPEKIKRAVQFIARWPLVEAWAETIAWYRQNRLL